MNTTRTSAWMLLALASIGAPASRAQCEEQKLLDPTVAAHDLFGHAVAIDGDVAVVGAPSFWNSPTGPGTGVGRAFVYRHSGGTWLCEQILSPPIAREKYGWSVAIDGDVIAVGARYGNGVAFNTGAAYVYRHTPSSPQPWQLEQKLTAADGQSGDSFGFSIAVSGDLIAVGAPQNDDNALDSGSVYFFHREGGSWIQRGNWHLASPALDDWFGYSVALAGSTAAAGAPIKNSSRGLVSSIGWSAGPYWLSYGTLTAPDGASYDGFGESLAIDSGYLIVGAPDHDSGGRINAGAVYVYDQPVIAPLRWRFRQKLTGSGCTAGSEWFGTSVAIDGDAIAIGAPGEDPTGGRPCGAAYVFRRSGGTFAEEGLCWGSTSASGDLFGQCVAMSGEALLVGAHLDDDQGRDSGTAWIFRNASRENYGSGWPGTSGVPALTASADPVLGTSFNLQIGNSLGANTAALLILGFSPAAIPSGLGGTLLVTGFIYAPLTVPAAGIALPIGVPCMGSYTGTALYFQVLEADPGATAGIAFSRGLQITLGQF